MLPHVFSACLAARLDDVRKMLLIDICNRPWTRVPLERSTSGCAAFTTRTAGCFLDRDRVLPFAAPDRLSTIQSRPGTRLTARPPASVVRSLCSVSAFAENRRGHQYLGAALAGRSQPRTKAAEQPLTLLSFSVGRLSSSLRRTRTASTAVSSKTTTFPAQNVFHRQVSHRNAFTFSSLVGARHRSRDFAVNDSASDALSHF